MKSTVLTHSALMTILSLLVIATACSTDDTNKNASVADKFNFGQTIVIKSNSPTRVTTFNGTESIDIQVTSINDSRCPSNGVCIWAGKVDVTFKIGGIDQPVTLCSGETSSCNNPYEFTVDKIHYKLTLKDVTPYPSGTNENEEKKVKFIVEVI